LAIVIPPVHAAVEYFVVVSGVQQLLKRQQHSVSLALPV
jgi:hypothetical protein